MYRCIVFILGIALVSCTPDLPPSPDTMTNQNTPENSTPHASPSWDGDPKNEQYYLQGIEDAKKDLAANNYKYEAGTLTFPWFAKYREILQSTYGIELVSIGAVDGRGSHISGENEAHARGYNSIALPALYAKFGPDILQKAALEAQQWWQQQ